MWCILRSLHSPWELDFCATSSRGPSIAVTTAARDVPAGAIDEESAAERGGSEVRDPPPQWGPGDIGRVGVGGCLGSASG